MHQRQGESDGRVTECEAKVRRECDQTVDTVFPQSRSRVEEEEEEAGNKNHQEPHIHTQTHSLLSKITERTTEILTSPR